MSNRAKGLDVEREVIKYFSEQLNLTRFPGHNYQIGSSRALSKATDDAGVDIVFTSLAPDYLRRLNVQIKRRTIRTKVVSIDLEPLIRIEGFSRPTLISKILVPKGRATKVLGYYVTIKLDDYIELVRSAIELQELKRSESNSDQNTPRSKRRR